MRGSAEIVVSSGRTVWLATAITVLLWASAFTAIRVAGAWAYVLARLPASRTLVALYMVPPLAAPIGWLTLAEVPAARAVFGTAVALGGVALLTVSRT